MTREVLAFLAPEHGGVFVDCTIGLGGHARAVLESGATRVIGLDRDSAALAVAARNLEAWGSLWVTCAVPGLPLTWARQCCILGHDGRPRPFSCSPCYGIPVACRG